MNKMIRGADTSEFLPKETSIREFNNNHVQIEEIDESSSEIKRPFDPTKIDITIKPLIIDSLIKRMKSKPPRINLQSEFQRKGNLWKNEAQSRLIESLLVRIPLPAFYLDGTDENNWLVVDGLQRLSTLKNFIIDKTLKLSNLEFLHQYEGSGFDDLPAFLQGRIEETQITAFIINPGTPAEVKFNIFRRINTGGLILKPQEIRHALNQGIPAGFVKDLAELSEFKKATDYRLAKSERMEDRDFATRFVGFYNGYKQYKPDLDSFLNEAMANLNRISAGQRNQIKEDFIKAMNAAYKIFYRDAFRKRFYKSDPRNPLNKALFETWSVNLAKLSDDELNILINKKDKIKEDFMQLLRTDDAFVRSVSAGTGDSVSVERRFSKIETLINTLLNDNES